VNRREEIMRRFFIITTNCALLVFLLIGIPAATGARLGDWQVSSAPAARLLLFLGLGIAAAGNVLAALFFIKGRTEKILCWEWSAVFSMLLLAHWAFTRGYFNFEWLKRMLLWLQKHF
jgi:hypothetical protein